MYVFHPSRQRWTCKHSPRPTDWPTSSRCCSGTKAKLNAAVGPKTHRLVLYTGKNAILTLSTTCDGDLPSRIPLLPQNTSVSYSGGERDSQQTMKGPQTSWSSATRAVRADEVGQVDELKDIDVPESSAESAAEQR